MSRENSKNEICNRTFIVTLFTELKLRISAGEQIDVNQSILAGPLPAQTNLGPKAELKKSDTEVQGRIPSLQKSMGADSGQWLSLQRGQHGQD